MHMEMILILLATLVAAQLLLYKWKQHHYRTYHVRVFCMNVFNTVRCSKRCFVLKALVILFSCTIKVQILLKQYSLVSQECRVKKLYLIVAKICQQQAIYIFIRN